MDNPFIYILINGSLNMSSGKVAAQAVHALASLEAAQGIGDFSNQTKRTVIVLKAQNQEQMDNLFMYLDKLDIPTADYIDEGHNEVQAYSTTAMAVGPIAANDTAKREIFKDFPLYKDVKIVEEDDDFIKGFLKILKIVFVLVVFGLGITVGRTIERLMS